MKNFEIKLSDYGFNILQIESYAACNMECSFCPYPLKDDKESKLSLEDIDSINLKLHRERPLNGVLLPVNHGACLYIKRSVLEIVGGFDEFTFGRGYSEEIDLCLRLRKNGLHNVGCYFAFIQHVGGVSFGSKIDPLKLKNRKIIAEKYPKYFSEIGQFVTELKRSKIFTDVCALIDSCI